MARPCRTEYTRNNMILAERQRQDIEEFADKEKELSKFMWETLDPRVSCTQKRIDEEGGWEEIMKVEAKKKAAGDWPYGPRKEAPWVAAMGSREKTAKP